MACKPPTIDITREKYDAVLFDLDGMVTKTAKVHKDNIKMKDPVCGMEIDDAQARQRTLYMGEKYFFCSEDCKVKFESNPENMRMFRKMVSRKPAKWLLWEPAKLGRPPALPS